MIVEIQISQNEMTQEEFDALREIIPEVQANTEQEVTAWLSTDDKAKAEADGQTEEEALKLKRKARFERLTKDGRVEIKDRWTTYSVDILELLGACPSIKFEIQRRISKIGTTDGFGTEVMNRLFDLTDQYTKATNLFNERCGVHVGGNPLMQIANVQVLYNACTDDLQRALDEGWQIIAVCVQPNKSRPDYILGLNSGLKIEED